jgi:hypothetical protein
MIGYGAQAARTDHNKALTVGMGIISIEAQFTIGATSRFLSELEVPLWVTY